MINGKMQKIKICHKLYINNPHLKVKVKCDTFQSTGYYDSVNLGM